MKLLFSPLVWKIIIYSVLFFSVFHLIRDLFQIYHINTFISISLNTSKNWCNPYCDFVTIPAEVFVILGSVWVLWTKKYGILAKLVILVFGVWAAVFWWSYFYR